MWIKVETKKILINPPSKISWWMDTANWSNLECLWLLCLQQIESHGTFTPSKPYYKIKPQNEIIWRESLDMCFISWGNAFNPQSVLVVPLAHLYRFLGSIIGVITHKFLPNGMFLPNPFFHFINWHTLGLREKEQYENPHDDNPTSKE